MQERMIGHLKPPSRDIRLLHFLVDTTCILLLLHFLRMVVVLPVGFRRGIFEQLLAIVPLGLPGATFLSALLTTNWLAATVEALLSAGVMYAYYFFFEALCSVTPAKFMTRTRVVTREGAKPGIKAIAWRTAVRLLPFEAFTRKKHTLWHDRASETLVVKI